MKMNEREEVTKREPSARKEFRKEPFHHQQEFDTDIEDPHAYKERQESYIEGIDLEDDPGVFEN